MGQRPNDAVSKDAKMVLSKEEYASSMGQRSKGSDVALKDAQTKFTKEEYA